MKLATLFFATMTSATVLLGQDSADQSAADVAAVQELVEELRDMQPPDWSYSELANKADLVVIAKAVSRVELERNHKLGGDFGKETTRLMSNRLRILSVLKGKAGDELNVLTLEWKPNSIVLTNSDFAKFRSKLLLPDVVPVVIDGEIVDYGHTIPPNQTYTIEPEYLVYLHKVEGDRYVPVTGQRYSGLSVRRLR